MRKVGNTCRRTEGPVRRAVGTNAGALAFNFFDPSPSVAPVDEASCISCIRFMLDESVPTFECDELSLGRFTDIAECPHNYTAFVNNKFHFQECTKALTEIATKQNRYTARANSNPDNVKIAIK